MWLLQRGIYQAKGVFDPQPGGGGGPLVITGGLTAPAIQVGTGFNLGNTITFTAASIGTAASDRIVLVSTAFESTADTTLVTIGGSSATKATGTTFGGNEGAQLWYLLVTAGTTANIVVSGGTNYNACGIQVATMTGSATASVSSSATPVAANTGADPVSIGPVTIPSNGAAVIAGYTNGTISGDTWTAGTTGRGTNTTAPYSITLASNTTSGAQTPAWTRGNFQQTWLAMSAFTP